MEIRYISEFVHLARRLNFTETAAFFFITQPTLTRHILHLERELGVSLFLRDTHAVSLTEEGRKFLPIAEKIVDASDQAFAMLNPDYQKKHHLVFGFRPIYSQDFILHEYIDNFIVHFPGTKIDFCSMFDLKVLSEKLEQGSIDVLLSVSGKYGSENNVFSRKILWHTPLCAVVGVNHPWAARKEIIIRDLDEQPLILPEKSLHGLFPVALEKLFQENGITPAECTYSRSTDEGDMLVSLYKYIHIVPECYCNMRADSQNKVIPIADTKELFSVELLWNRKSKNPAIKNFLSCFTSFSET